MWRFYYTIVRNLFRAPGVIAQMRRLTVREPYSEEENYTYLRYITAELMQTGHIRTQCYGMEHLPQDGGYWLCPNHQGKFDAFGIISAHEKPCTAVMDEEKSRIIFINEIVDMQRGKRLELNNPRKAIAVIDAIAKEVEEGRRYILFPEGGYTKETKNTPGEFKPGCFRIALRSKRPIVPVVLIDSYKVYNSWQLTPVTTQVHFLPPIYYEEFKDMKTVQIANMVRERIVDKMQELAAGK